MMVLAQTLLLLILSTVYVLAKFPFQDPTLPWDKRVDDLVSRLTIEEVANQTLAIVEDPSYTAVPRLGINTYVWNTECSRGQSYTNSTSYPQSIGLGAAWSKQLMMDMTEAISSEVRGQWNARRKIGQYVNLYGLSCLSPVINIARHPLWGRTQETYGECPFLIGTLVQGFITGIHGNHSRYVKANAGCKHFDVHGGPDNIPVSRFSFDSKVSTRDWRMTFLPAFKMCIEAGTYNLMCSYNSVNGIPACANAELLTNIARKEMGFKGFVISDESAIQYIQTGHKYTKSVTESVTDAIKAGCNLELATSKSTVYLNQLDALKKGMLTEKQLRDNIKPMIYMRMRLGEFDPDSMNPYKDIDMSVVQSAKNRALSMKAAQMSFTLLKNDMDALPLKAQVSNLAIVGPFGNVSDQLFGDYSSYVPSQFIMTVWQGLKKLSKGKVSFGQGCDDTNCANYNSVQVKTAVTGSDLVIVALGTGQAVETEGHDRANLELPGHQLGLLQDAVNYANGAKLIVLLFNAGPLDVTWAKLDTKVHAIMACFLPAQSTGEALYNTLMATTADGVPAGRLPMTWPAYLDQVPGITNYDMQGHTYRYYRGEPLYPFGYGLSYTTFEYSKLTAMPTVFTKGQSVKVSVNVKNTGMYDADEVTQLYISWPTNATVPVPKIQLVGFTRQRIVKNQQIVLDFEITSDQLAVWTDDKTGWGYIPGKMLLYAGGQQPNTRTTVKSNILSLAIYLKG